jgi:hypothetical protein
MKPMSAIGGMFNIIQAGQLGSLVSSMRASDAAAAAGSTDPSTWQLKRGESAIEAFWRLAPDAAKENAPTLDLMKRLEKLKASGNSDISAEKLRQAKARLNALRQQLQLAAISNDPRQIRRLAAEAAQLARAIGAAARDLSHGIAAGVATYSSDAQLAQSTANGAAATPGTADLAGGGERDAAFKALHQVGTDARGAIAQAKGLIALAAQMARARRRENEDDDDYFRRLQELVDAGLDDVDAGQREAIDHLLLSPDAGTGFGVEISTTTIDISVTTLAVVSEEAAGAVLVA